MQPIVPSLWFEKEVEAACRFYVSIFPNSRIDRIGSLAAESPSGPAGSVVTVEFTLMGQPWFAMQAGPLDAFNHAVSFTIPCDTQGEIDRLWERLAEGGSHEPCGWVRDRWGVAWQIVPANLNDLHADPDRGKAARVAAAMLKMGKLDKAALEAAAGGDAA